MSTPLQPGTGAPGIWSLIPTSAFGEILPPGTVIYKSQGFDALSRTLREEAIASGIGTGTFAAVFTPAVTQDVALLNEQKLAAGLVPMLSADGLEIIGWREPSAFDAPSAVLPLDEPPDVPQAPLDTPSALAGAELAQSLRDYTATVKQWNAEIKATNEQLIASIAAAEREAQRQRDKLEADRLAAMSHLDFLRQQLDRLAGDAQADLERRQLETERAIKESALRDMLDDAREKILQAEAEGLSAAEDLAAAAEAEAAELDQIAKANVSKVVAAAQKKAATTPKPTTSKPGASAKPGIGAAGLVGSGAGSGALAKSGGFPWWLVLAALALWKAKK